VWCTTSGSFRWYQANPDFYVIFVVTKGVGSVMKKKVVGISFVVFAAVSVVVV